MWHAGLMASLGHERSRNPQKNISNDGRGQFWLTRIVFLRCLGFIYLVAFLVALNDNEALVRGCTLVDHEGLCEISHEVYTSAFVILACKHIFELIPSH